MNSHMSNTHRPIILGRDTCNGTCEQACGCLCVEQQKERQGRGPVPKYTGPRNKPSKAIRVIFWTAVCSLGVALAWHFVARGGGMSVLHVYAPPGEHFAVVNHCPTCERPRRMHGWWAEWHGATLTCAGCGDQWSDGEMHERPFVPGWRRRNIEAARQRLATIGVQA